ncbi:MAG: hypothetical protein FWC53_00820 [Firmicutes bacterium]|nr:hypothetical protein [Bacillota bacterium]
MSSKKQVDFIEKVDRSVLGLDGMQIVVYSDRCRLCEPNELEDEEYNFKDIGKRCLKEVDGEFIKKKYGIKEGVELKEKLHEERVKWMRENI